MCKKAIVAMGMLFFLLCTAWTDSVRRYVCTVFPSEDDDVVTLVREFAKDEADSYTPKRELTSRLASMPKPGFVIEKDGKKYVLTNEVSVKDCSFADIVFYADDATETVYKKQPVIATKHSIALIALPPEYTGGALTLADAPLQDGQTVYAGCFISVKDTHIWRLATGTVENGSFAWESVSYAAHTIESLPSGAPLLIADSRVSCGYRLAGMLNSFIKRDANDYLFTAYTTETLRDFLQNPVQQEQQSLDEAIQALLVEANKADADFSSLIPFISDDLALRYGVRLFDITYTKMNYDSRWILRKQCEHSLLGGFKAAVAYYVWQELKKQPKKELSAEIAETTVTFSQQGKHSHTSQWIAQDGTFVLNNFDTIEETKIKKERAKSQKDLVDYVGMLEVGRIFPTETENEDGYDIKMGMNVAIVGWGIFFQSETVDMHRNETIEDTVMRSGGLFLRMQLPLPLWKFLVIPYGEARMGIANLSQFSKNDSTTRVYFGGEVGVDLAFRINEYVAPVVTAYVLHSSYNGNAHSNNYGIAAGIRFFPLGFD